MTVGIVNPAARGGWLGRRWAHLQPAIEAHLGPVDWRHTTAERGARALAEALAPTAPDRVFVVGGDGTVSQVVDGLIAGGAPPQTAVGILPGGTGGDFRRTLGLPADPIGAAARLVGAVPRPLDVIEAAFGGQRRACVNLASTGINAHVDRRVNASKKRLGGRLSFFWATVRAELAYTPITLDLQIDDGPTTRHTVASVLVCNGQYAGGGMHFAPGARLDDGHLEVLLLAPRGLPAGVTLLRALYAGTQDALPGVQRWRGRQVRLTPVEGEALLDIDGEVPGAAPVVFTVAPGRLRALWPVG